MKAKTKTIVSRVWRTAIVPIVLLLLVLLCASCSKNELPEEQAHGKITIVTLWPKTGTGITMPDSYAVKIDDYQTTLSGNTNTLDKKFAPNTYRVLAYNTPENITIEGSTANAHYDGGLLGWLFAAATDTKVNSGATSNVSVVMKQQVREMNISITPTGDAGKRIVSVNITLSGVASTLDFDNNVYGAPVRIKIPLAKQTSGENAGKWTAIIRLLGVSSKAPVLTSSITLDNGNVSTQTFEDNLMSLYDFFNDYKSVPISLSSEVVEVMTDGGYSYIIRRWAISPANYQE